MRFVGMLRRWRSRWEHRSPRSVSGRLSLGMPAMSPHWRREQARRMVRVEFHGPRITFPIDKFAGEQGAD